LCFISLHPQKETETVARPYGPQPRFGEAGADRDGTSIPLHNADELVHAARHPQNIELYEFQIEDSTGAARGFA
jgi:hypothetical protein